MNITTRPCRDCGTPVEREEEQGPFAQALNGRSFQCDACSEQAQREFEQEELQEQQRRKAEARQLRIVRSGLPLPRQRFHLADLDGTGARARVLSDARRWVIGELPALLLTGGVGVGKTAIAAAAAMDRLEGADVRWVTALAFTADLQAPFDSQERRNAQALMDGKPRPRPPRALIVDDLDKVRGTESAGAAMFGLIDACEAIGRPLIVTTNLRPSELAQKWPKPYGESIASRLAGYCVSREVAGADRRVTRTAA